MSTRSSTLSSVCGKNNPAWNPNLARGVFAAFCSRYVSKKVWVTAHKRLTLSATCKRRAYRKAKDARQNIGIC